MEAIIDKVRDFIDLHGMIKKNDRVLLSLSAGKDSMFLLHAFMLLKDVYHIEIGVFHLNHMMRGEESDADESHVASVAESLSAELVTMRHDFKSSTGGSFEERARNIRYQLLEEAAVSGGYSKIATGHTRDDNVETLLMRIFTGTGIYGLKGIAPVRGRIIRPLLALSSAEIYEYLTSHRIAWREDSTNRDSSYSRNFIRNEMLPLARGRFPMIYSSVTNLCDVATESIELIDKLLNEAFPGLVEKHDNDVYIDVRRIIHNRPAFNHVVSAAIRNYFAHNITRSLLNEIYFKFGTEKSNAALFVNNTIRADKLFIKGSSILKISAISGAVSSPVKWEKQIRITGNESIVVPLQEIGASVEVKICDNQYYQNFEKNDHSVFLAVGNDVDTIYIRNRRNGDRIKTECGVKKLKDLFIEWKLAGYEKDRIPIIIIGTAVAAIIPGILNDTPNRVSSDFLVDKNSKKVISVSACR